MVPPAPFAYPASAHPRRHAPAGYVDFRSYKPWLRDEFKFRCVYCLERERWYPSRAAAFSVDHVVPQISDPTRVCTYENLVYACLRCNFNKRDLELPDPTEVSFGDCLRVDVHGVFSALNADGADLIDLLHLNDSPVIDTRRAYLRLIKLKIENPDHSGIHQLFLDAFSFPDDLPNLETLRPPSGNRTSPSGASSYFTMRRANQLDPIY